MNNARIASLLRKNVWWMDLVVIGLVAYFLANICNAGLAWNVGRLPSVDDVVPVTSSGGKVLQSHHVPLAQFSERNLMGLKRESLAPVPGVTVADQPVVDLTARDFKESELQACSVNAVVRGTMVADRPEWSMAVVVRNDTHEPGVYSATEGHNAIFEDAIIVAIRSREVIVRRRDHFERCLGDGDAPPPPTLMPTPLPPEEGPAGAGEVTGVTKVSGTDYRVERAEVDKALSNLNEVATQARIVPSFKNGKANGFKMFSIKKGSIYDKIGLTNGDVIQKINGYDMNSPDRALEIYGKLRDATSLSIELTRGANNMTLNYMIN